MKYNALILSLLILFTTSCIEEKPAPMLTEGWSFNAPAFLFFKNIRSNAYAQEKKGKYLDSYRLKQFQNKPFSVVILVSPLEDKAVIGIELHPNYELWESIVDGKPKLIPLDKMNANQQLNLLRKMSRQNGSDYALQHLDPNSNGSVETISTRNFRKKITICLSDFDRLTEGD